MTAVERAREWLRRKFGTELPCGCIASDGRGARFSHDTTVANRDHNAIRSIAYRNCTKYENEWKITVRCDLCGAMWKERTPAGSRIDYGDENPDAGLKLKTKHRGKHVIHKEVPIVQDEEGRV